MKKKMVIELVKDKDVFIQKLTTDINTLKIFT